MLLIMSLLIWTALYIPYRLAFIDDASLPIFIMECIMDGIFLIDIVFNFFTAFYDNDTILITDRRIIAAKYLKSWFLIDLISRSLKYIYIIYIYIYSLPFQAFDSSIKMNKTFRLFRIARIYRMFKVIKLIKMFNFVKPNKLYDKIIFKVKLHEGLIRLSKVLITMAFFMHFFSCFWYFIAKSEGFKPSCWIMVHGLLDASNLTKYLIAFYW